MNILALDLGTNTGWALGTESPDGSRLQLGTWTLMTRRQLVEQAQMRYDRRLDERVCVLWRNIAAIHQKSRLDWIVFEDVQFASTTLQAHLWASFRTVVWLFCDHHKIKCECLATGKLKLHATGHGAATKQMMEAWLIDKRPDLLYREKDEIFAMDGDGKLDDNSVDAAHLLLWAQRTFKK